MKYLMIVLLLIPLLSIGQTTGLQVGPLAAFSKKGGSGYGGELIATAGLSQSVSLGAGVQGISFNKYGNLYKPVFGTIKLNIPVKIFLLNFDANLGYGIYKNQTTTGGFYFASGLTLATLSKIGPYISLHYSNYEFHAIKKYTYTQIKESQGIEGVTISAGCWFKLKRKNS